MKITKHFLSDIEPALQLESRQRRPLPLSAIFVTLLIAWMVVNWPAFTQFWWHTDDFARGAIFDARFSLHQGRPLELVVPYLMHLDYSQQSIWLHQGIRLLQVSLHVLTTLLLARFFERLVGRWVAFSAILFFLFWPFHGEAVLWQSALAYPIAATLSLCGLHSLSNSYRRHPWLGALLIVAAMLTHQSASLAALLAWLIFQALFVFQHNRLDPNWLREAKPLIGGYIGGGLLSWGVIYLTLGELGRAALPTSIADKISFWLELNRHYLASPNYPPLLSVLQILLVVATVSFVAIAWWRKQKTLRQVVAAIGLLICLSLIPYLAVLLTVESSPAWRILYLAPLVSASAWLLLQELAGDYLFSRSVSWGAILLFLWIYIPMNIHNAADYVTVFNADLQTLHVIEDFAAKQRPPRTRITVATYPGYLRTWELYDVAYMHYDSKKSAFLRDWTAIPFLNRFSSLMPNPTADSPLVQEQTLAQQCVSLCWVDGQQQPWQLLAMPDAQTICVCP